MCENDDPSGGLYVDLGGRDDGRSGYTQGMATIRTMRGGGGSQLFFVIASGLDG